MEMASLNGLKGNMLSSLMSFFVYRFSREELISNLELKLIRFKHKVDVQIHTIFRNDFS